MDKRNEQLQVEFTEQLRQKEDALLLEMEKLRGNENELQIAIINNTEKLDGQLLATTKEQVQLKQQSSTLLLEMDKLRGNEEKLRKKSEETAKQVMQLELELDKLRGNEVAQQSQEKHEALLQEIEKLLGNEEQRIEAVKKIQEALGKQYEREKLRDNETYELRESLKVLKENYERLRADVCSTNAVEDGGSGADVSTNAVTVGGSRADGRSTNAVEDGGSGADVCSFDSASSLAEVCNTKENDAGDCQSTKRAIETAIQRAIKTAFEKCAIETAFEKRLQAEERMQSVADMQKRLDKAINATHAANQTAREQDKQELLQKQATVEHAQSQLQNTVDQHGKWIHEHYNVNVARIESRVKPLTDEVRKLRADVDGRPQQDDITKLKEQMKEQLKEQMQDFRRASTNIGVSQEALTTALACNQYTYQQRGRRNPDDHWMRNNPLAVIYQ